MRISTKAVGGSGSGHYGQDTRRQVEWCFALNVHEVVGRRPRAGHEAKLALRAPLMAWAARGHVLVRNDGSGHVATIWVAATWGAIRTDARIRAVAMVSGGLRYYFACPRCDGRVVILYWPFNDAAGLACRACHGLAYRSSQMRKEWPKWLQRLAVEANGKRLPGPRL